jgi:hypothetical protein
MTNFSTKKKSIFRLKKKREFKNKKFTTMSKKF